MKSKHLIQALFAVLLLAGFSGIAAYADEAAQQVELKPSDLKWAPIPYLPPGAQRAVMQGDSSKPGPYVVRVKFPANYQVPAHFHPDNRTYTIISGTWYEANGDKFDATKLKAYPVGSFLTGAAKTNHFDATKGEEVIFQVSGTGPTSTDFVDPKDDPRKKQ